METHYFIMPCTVCYSPSFITVVFCFKAVCVRVCVSTDSSRVKRMCVAERRQPYSGNDWCSGGESDEDDKGFYSECVNMCFQTLSRGASAGWFEVWQRLIRPAVLIRLQESYRTVRLSSLGRLQLQ